MHDDLHATVVVISKKLITFAETSTATVCRRESPYQLWLAKNWLPLQRHQQPLKKAFHAASVVISKKLITFAETSTARGCIYRLGTALWLAKNWLPLQRHQQRRARTGTATSVVISKKLITFAETSTARFMRRQERVWLWLAKNWLPLQRHQQPRIRQRSTSSVVISKKLITFAETSTAQMF